MKSRIFLMTALLALAGSTFALSTEYAQWGEGPAQFLMTKEEAARWKSIKTDEEAKAFVDLFWARRDPTVGTPRNEFKEEFDARVDYADKNLATNKKIRGSVTDRGKVFVLYGQPKKMERAAARQQQPGSFDDSATSSTEAESPTLIWHYDGEEMKDFFNTNRATIRFVDRLGNGEYKIERGSVDLNAAQQRAIVKAIKQPDLTAAPASAAPASAAPAMPAAAPVAQTPAMQTELTTESLKAAVNDFKAAAKSPYEKQTFASWGEFVTPAGTYFVPVMLFVPKSAGLTSSQSLTFFGVVQDESGKNVLAFEQPATLVASKDDLFVDKTLTGLTAGKHRGFFGLAENGKPVSIAAADMSLAGSLDKDATAISGLMLSNNVFPLETAQEATDPFSFGGVKVVPKADRVFRTSDELWYFFELRNPGIAEPAAPADGTAPATAEGTPKIQVKIDVEGKLNDGSKKKMAAPPTEVAAIAMKGVPGHYGVGNSIPLTSFKPGDYTFTVKVIDTVKKTSYTMSEKFKVVE